MAYQKTVPTPTDASIILTYRCPMKCKMCNIWFNPTNKSEEIKASDLRTLPKLKFINLTGGDCGGMLPAYRPYCHFDERMV